MLLIANMVAFAQLGKINEEGFQQLQSGTMAVVLNGDEVHNQALKKAVEENWKHTPFIFTYKEEMKQYIGNPKYFFLMLTDTYKKMGTSVHYSTLLAIVENKEGAEELNTKRWKAFYTFIHHEENSFYNFDEQYLHKLPDFVRNLSWQWEHTAKNEGKWSLIDPYKIIKEASSELPNKTLLLEKNLCNNELAQSGEYKKYYKYNIKLSDEAEVGEAIKNKDSSKAYAYYSQDDKGGAALSIWEAGTGRCLALVQLSVGAVSNTSGSYGTTHTSGNLKGVLFDRIGKKELKKLK